MPLQVFTGPRCRFTIEGVVVALGRNASANEEYQYEPIDVLDNIESLGHEPVGYRCGLRASQILLVDQTLESLGYVALKGQSPQDHLRNVLALPSLVAQIEDNQLSIVIARIFGVRLASKDFAVDARGMVMQELSFVATRVVGASENL
jgi:hypothetical protein